MPPVGGWKLDLQELDDIDLDPSDFNSSLPLKKVPNGDVFEASRAGDVDRLRYLLELGVNVNARDQWDSVALYYACLAGHLDAARILLESGAICSEHTFDGDRCHYAALNLNVRKLLKAYEARPPPLAPLQASLRDAFLGCNWNASAHSSPLGSNHVPSDVIFYVQGKPLEAHRVILCARSKFFKKKFETEWKDRREVRLGSGNLSYTALHSLIHFFYSDRLELPMDSMEDLLRICKVCRCDSLYRVLEKELFHQRNAEYKSLNSADASQKRFILHGTSLPEDDRLPAALRKMLKESSADFRVRIGEDMLQLHKVVVASRSEYFRARLTHLNDSNDGKPCIEEHDVSSEVFEKMVEYMYTDSIGEINHQMAEEMFDASSRYLLFPLKRAVGEILLPYIETVSPSELCHWLVLSEIYGVGKIRELCLDRIADDFETFVDTPEFRVFLLSLPPPSGDSSLRTTLPSVPGADSFSDQANLLDDLREKWLQAQGAELDKRDESALLFDKRLEMLMLDAHREFGLQ